MEVLLKNVPAPDLELGDASGSTPLIIAGAAFQHLAVSPLANLLTILHRSVSSGIEANVVALLGAGANPATANSKGQTPLYAFLRHPTFVPLACADEISLDLLPDTMRPPRPGLRLGGG